MDERIWLSGANLHDMLAHLRQTANVQRRKAGRRKLRLLTCACARAVWDRLSQPCRALVEGVELLVDERMTQEEYDRREAAVRQHFMERVGEMRPGNADGIVFTVMMTRSLSQMAEVASSQIALASADVEALLAGTVNVWVGETMQRAIAESGRRAAELAREIFGNPFRPLPQRKFPADVRGLAEACFDDATNYPLLADALADLGEDAAAEHCRTPGHVRGCHVADWVTGRG